MAILCIIHSSMEKMESFTLLGRKQDKIPKIQVPTFVRLVRGTKYSSPVWQFSVRIKGR
jgi:hypothetical protein